MAKRAVKIPSPRLHHWLIAGKVTFQAPDREGVGFFEHNTVVTNTKNFVTANMIGEAQRRIQIELFQQMGGDPNMKVVNVHIQTVNYLGAMTKEEFYTPPPKAEEGPVDETPEVPAKPAAIPVTADNPYST